MNKKISNSQQATPNVIPDGYIVDYIDGKFRKDTPEEYVRQNIEKKLVLSHKYPKEKIRVEFKINAYSKKPRLDLAIFISDESVTQENIDIIIGKRALTDIPAGTIISREMIDD